MKVTTVFTMALILMGSITGCKLPKIHDPDPRPDPAPVVNPVPVPEPAPSPVVVPDDGDTTNAVPLYAPVYSTEGATEIRTSGGFVWNPDNSRGRGKTVWPTKYSGKIAWVVAWSPNGYRDVYKRATPNEDQNRQRYYGSTPIGSVPSPLYIRAHVIQDGKAADVYVIIDNSQNRES